MYIIICHELWETGRGLCAWLQTAPRGEPRSFLSAPRFPAAGAGHCIYPMVVNILSSMVY